MKNPDCCKCYKSAAVKCYYQDNERYYCTWHFQQLLTEEELTQIEFLPKKGADLERT